MASEPSGTGQESPLAFKVNHGEKSSRHCKDFKSIILSRNFVKSELPWCFTVSARFYLQGPSFISFFKAPGLRSGIVRSNDRL